MSVQEYEDRGPQKVTSELKLGNLEGKSVIITGGASGLGKAYAKCFADAGAYVTVADFNEDAGKATMAELSSKAQFVKCDVRSWDDQVKVFEAAITSSPHKSCDVVIANAGIVGADDLYTFQVRDRSWSVDQLLRLTYQLDPTLSPLKPDLRIIDVNLIGMIYTVKLALHYFRRQAVESSRDRCLIIKASIAAYADQPGSPQYNIAKWGARGLMRNLRRTAWKENIRVNLVAPWYVRTPILPQAVQDYIDDQGVGFALVEDCCKAMLKIASDTTVNGRGIGVMSRKVALEGYVDLDHDDYHDSDPFKEWQQIVLDTAHKIVE